MTEASIARTETGGPVHAAGVGVIGLAGWRERSAAPSYVNSPLRARGTMGHSVAVAAAAGGSSLGMHAGQTRHDPVGRTTFERDGSPDVLTIGYDTLAALEAMGITQRRPNPFPGRTTGYEAYQA